MNSLTNSLTQIQSVLTDALAMNDGNSAIETTVPILLALDDSLENIENARRLGEEQHSE